MTRRAWRPQKLSTGSEALAPIRSPSQASRAGNTTTEAAQATSTTAAPA